MLKACEQLFNTKKIELYGAGRTDAGVHALGQVAHLDVPTQMHAETMAGRLNEILPYDIHVLTLEKCDAAFHARHNAVDQKLCVHHFTAALGLLQTLCLVGKGRSVGLQNAGSRYYTQRIS
jgi:tRNA pseudouridine(38-40) synthase